MDIERIMDIIAAQDTIVYSFMGKGMTHTGNMKLVYATIKDGTIVVASTDAEIMIDLDVVTKIEEVEDKDMIRIYMGDDRCYISYQSENKLEK